MNIEITELALSKLEELAIKENEKKLQISMVKYDCNGPLLSMSIAGKNEDALFEVTANGYRFVVKDDLQELFPNLRIDYEEGLNEGFVVRHQDALLESCYEILQDPEENSII